MTIADSENMFAGWDTLEHAEAFDRYSHIWLWELRRILESFNEIRLFNENKDEIRGRTVYEIGCATGELYRYMNAYHPEFAYRGFDISQICVVKAREKFPIGEFLLCDANLNDVRDLDPPDVLIARDVVLHQPDPLDFLKKLTSIPSEAILLRLRTRDLGKTILDPDQSCQYTYGTWVPYFVLNIDEMIEAIIQLESVVRVHIVKHYKQLGGHSGRFLPKDCYLWETGTAETAVYILKGTSNSTAPSIEVTINKDRNPSFSLPERVARRVSRIFREQGYLN